MLLQDKVAIITGGAGGMGRAMSVKFASEGCDVAVADINLQGAQETLAEVKKLGRDGLAIQTDVTKGAQVEAMVNQVVEKFGRIDIMINNAGTLFDVANVTDGSVADISESDWDKLVEINLKGAFLGCKYVTPHMKKRRYGKIVNFSTVGAIHPPAVCPHYNAAKAGVLGLTYDVASELGPFNINVNAVLPGPIRTPFYKKIMAGLSEKEQAERYAWMCRGTPLQRMGEPEDIAGVALFLASELSAYMTGSGLVVAGGMPLEPRLPLAPDEGFNP